MATLIENSINLNNKRIENNRNLRFYIDKFSWELWMWWGFVVRRGKKKNSLKWEMRMEIILNAGKK
jgi:flagellar biosynthesis regulator FlaF